MADAEDEGGNGTSPVATSSNFPGVSSELVRSTEALKRIIRRDGLVRVLKRLPSSEKWGRSSVGAVQDAVASGASVDEVRYVARSFPHDFRRDMTPPLHLALTIPRWELVDVLIDACPAAVNTECQFGNARLTPLHMAVLKDAPLHIVERLATIYPDALQKKAPPNQQWLPLHLAAGKGCRMETFLFLLDRYEMGLREKSLRGLLPLHFAITNRGELKKIQIMADRYPQGLFEEMIKGLMPLHLAAVHGAPLNIVQFLSYKGPRAVLEKTSKNVPIPLSFAIRNDAPMDVIDFLARMTNACRYLIAIMSPWVMRRRIHFWRITKLQALWRRAVVYKQYGRMIRTRAQFKIIWSTALELVLKGRHTLDAGPDWTSWRETHYDMERCLRADVLQSLEEAKLESPNDEILVADERDAQGTEPKACEEAGECGSLQDNDPDEDYVSFEAHEASLSNPVQVVNRVLLTNDVLKWCRSGDPKYVGFFIRRIEQLASGQRSRILAKRLKGGFKAAIFETYLEQKSGHRILWTTEALGEVLVWHVVAHKDVSRFARLIDSSLGRSSRQLSDALPTLGISSAASDVPSHADAILLDSLGNTPLKLYAVMSQHIPRLADPTWTPPLRLTPEERVVVEASGTTLVLGRSGTGKTICLCSKIDFDRHLTGSSTAFKQLFVTRSGRLRTFVKNAVSSDTCDFSTFDELIMELEHSLSTQSKFPLGQRVDFARFKRDFYRDSKLWGGVEALVVWTNIRSFIKGSIDALSSPYMILSNDDYLSVEKLGKKRCRLPPEQRQVVYEAFSAYSKYLEDSCLWDDCDRIIYLIQRLSAFKETDPDGFESLRYSKVYIDECQDFTQAEILLFFYLSRSGDLFLCGDPAQSVVEGVQFRFKEVRSVAHFAAGASHGCGVPQKPLTLNVNYRSHSGIMKIAAAVQKRMAHFFPDEANLQDRGLFVGPRPDVLFEADLVTFKGALSSLLSGSTVLVHDEQKTLCKQRLDGYKLLYGIRESKGLEFKSVILFDFFSGIPKELQKPWRDLLQGNEVADFASRFPEMEGQLKLLYTAITRSVDRLLFVESRRSAAGEAFVRWSTTTTTRLHSSDEEPLAAVQEVDDIESFRMTVDEWVLAGFDNAGAADDAEDPELSITFLEAAHLCFEKAGENRFVAKVQVHLASVELRSQIVEREAGNVTERIIADMLSRLLQEGLWTEAAKLIKAALPLVSEYTQNQLRETFLPKLPSV